MYVDDFSTGRLENLRHVRIKHNIRKWGKTLSSYGSLENVRRLVL